MSNSSRLGGSKGRCTHTSIFALCYILVKHLPTFWFGAEHLLNVKLVGRAECLELFYAFGGLQCLLPFRTIPALSHDRKLFLIIFFFALHFPALLMVAAIVSNNGQFLPGPRYSLDNMPKTGFTCRDKILGGYYADSETQCQMFHVCVKVAGVGVSMKFTGGACSPPKKKKKTVTNSHNLSDPTR